MGSADWMPRNMERRVELLFPVEDGKIKNRLMHILDVLLQDNLKAYQMQPDGSYARNARKDGISAHLTFCKEAKKANAKDEQDNNGRRFIPIWGVDVNDSE